MNKSFDNYGLFKDEKQQVEQLSSSMYCQPTPNCVNWYQN